MGELLAPRDWGINKPRKDPEKLLYNLTCVDAHPLLILENRIPGCGPTFKLEDKTDVYY